MSDLPDLAEFELRDHDGADLFGLFLGVHALPGAILLLHTTVGCKFKTQMHLAEHDWARRDSHNRRLWTGVDDVRIIRGSGPRLLEFALTWYERRKPELLLVTTNAAVELSSPDVEAAVEELSRRLPCLVVRVPAPGWSGSLAGGFTRVVRTVVDLCDWTRPATPGTVAVAGYVMDRYEMDHAANLAELRRLLALLSQETTAVLLSGESFAKTRDAAPRAARIVALPGMHAQSDWLADRTKRPVVTCDLPIGLRGTAAVARTLADAFGADRRSLDATLEREAARVEARLGPARDRLPRASAALFLDAPLAAGVYGWLDELGARVPLVCLTDGDPDGERRFRQALARLGVPDPDRPRVVANATRDGGLRAFRETLRGQGPVFVVGTAQQRVLEAACEARVVELAFPSWGQHWIVPMPWLGHAGAVALAQRFLDALRPW